MEAKLGYNQNPLERRIAVQRQIIQQMKDERNGGWYSPGDYDNANRQLRELYDLYDKSRVAGSKSKRHRRKTKYHVRCHKKSRKH